MKKGINLNVYPFFVFRERGYVISIICFYFVFATYLQTQKDEGSE